MTFNGLVYEGANEERQETGWNTTWGVFKAYVGFFVIKMGAPVVLTINFVIGLDQYNFLHRCGMGFYTVEAMGETFISAARTCHSFAESQGKFHHC